MKQYLFSLWISVLLFSLSSKAQINHFIYLQTENKQPFYVKFNKKIISSSASGYLIISKLQPGNYDLIIGFPKNEWAEQHFTGSVKNEDVGYLVKNFGEKGWGLFNLQTMQVAMTGEKNTEATVAKVDKTDEFSNLLSNVVNDPSILKKEVQRKDEIKTDSSSSASYLMNESKTEQGGIQKTESVTNIVVAVKSINDQIKLERKIEKIRQANDKAGLNIVYVDKGNEQSDTVNIYIPADINTIGAEVSTVVKQKDDQLQFADSTKIDQSLAVIAATPYTKKKSSVSENPRLSAKSSDSINSVNASIAPANEPLESNATIKQAKEEAVANSSKTKKQDEAKFLPIELTPVVDVSQNSKTDTIKESKVLDMENSTKNVITNPVNSNQKSSILMINSDCITNASNDDFLKLRKKMASAKTDDSMLEIAKKGLKAKCFSSEQVKNLGTLFLKESERYTFFDMAYQFVWDTHNFSSLEDQLSDPYYKSRFKAMIRH